MKAFLRFQFHKLFRQKSFYICLAILIGLQALVGVVAHAILTYAEGEAAVGGGILSVSSNLIDGVTLVELAMSGPYLMMLIAIVIALFVCMDFNYGTIKNIYGRGFSRTQVYFGTWIVSLVAALIMIAVVIGISFGIGTALGGVGDGLDGEFITDLLIQIACLLCRATLVYMVVTVIGKSGGSIAVCIAGPTLISLVCMLIDMIPKMPFEVSDYWIGNVQDEVMSGVTSSNALRVGLTLACYLVVSLLLGWLAARRKEV